MRSGSSIANGFRTAFREPAIVLAEIAWRWTFGLAAVALAAASLFAYLDTLPVSNVGVLTLRGHPSWLIPVVIGHFLQGGPRLLRVVALVLPAIFVLWVAAASLGRAATLKALLPRKDAIPLAPQFRLNLLRASVMLASIIGYLGAVILAGHAAAGAVGVRPGVFLATFVVLATAVTIVRSRVNWFLYLGAILAVRNGGDTFSAISGAAALFSRHRRTLIGSGALFGAIHVVLFAFATVVSLLVLLFAHEVPVAATLFLLTVITLAYFAATDFLYIARLAAYMALDESDRTPPHAPVSAEPAPAPEIPPVPEPPPLPDPGLTNLEGAGS